MTDTLVAVKTVRWGTSDELKFVKDLRKKNPKAYKRYADAVEGRADWGRIDMWTIVDYIVEHPPVEN